MVLIVEGHGSLWRHGRQRTMGDCAMRMDRRLESKCIALIGTCGEYGNQKSEIILPGLQSRLFTTVQGILGSVNSMSAVLVYAARRGFPKLAA